MPKMAWNTHCQPSVNMPQSARRGLSWVDFGDSPNVKGAKNTVTTARIIMKLFVRAPTVLKMSEVI